VIVVDTHVLIWWVNDNDRLSAAARKAFKQEQNGEGHILISAITAWEIALLAEKGRMALTMHVDDWLRKVAEIEGVRFVPVDNEVAVQSVRLPGQFHDDPADRMITALARQYSVPVVTSDKKIREYKYVKTIW